MDSPHPVEKHDVVGQCLAQANTLGPICLHKFPKGMAGIAVAGAREPGEELGHSDQHHFLLGFLPAVLDYASLN